MVALQVALDAPGRVRSLALLEPASRVGAGPQPTAAASHPIEVADESGDAEAAMDCSSAQPAGMGIATLDRVLPGAFDEAVGAAEVFFGAERSALEHWHLSDEEWQRIAEPVLMAVGTATAARYAKASEFVQGWIPHAERLEIPDAGHLLMVEQPDAVAAGLADFLTRHVARR